MEILIRLCDSCHRGYEDDIPVTSYIVKPKLGEEGYGIDEENVDLCRECLLNFKLENTKNDIYYKSTHKLI